MASTFSTNSKLEIITTGEKAGLWGNITNTNLQILEQLSTGYLSLDVASSDQALALDSGATSNGKNLYLIDQGLHLLHLNTPINVHPQEQ